MHLSTCTLKSELLSLTATTGDGGHLLYRLPSVAHAQRWANIGKLPGNFEVASVTMAVRQVVPNLWLKMMCVIFHSFCAVGILEGLLGSSWCECLMQWQMLVDCDLLKADWGWKIHFLCGLIVWLVSRYRQLAWGLNSSLSGTLHRTVWVSSWHNVWFLLEWVIQDAKREAALLYIT